MRKNQPNILSYLKSFQKDPLVESKQSINVGIDDALAVIDRKLSGTTSMGPFGSSGSALTVEE